MEYCIVLISLTLLVGNFEDIYAVKDEYNAYLNNNAGSMDCFDAYANCRKIPECKTALRILKKNCKSANGRCSTDSDLERCGEIADQLFMYGFQEKRCKCKSDKRMPKCFELLNRIYANPCFEEAHNVIKHSKNMQTHPQDEMIRKSAIQKKLMDVKPTAEPKSQGLASLEENHGEKIEIETMQSQEEEKLMFGDEGFAKLPQRRRTSPRIDRADAEKIANSENEKISPVLEEAKVTIAVPGDWTTETTEDSAAVPIRQQHYRITLEDTSWEMTADMKYRLLCIALGSLLVVAILVTMLYLAWQKISKLPFSYKNGKMVIQNNRGVA